MDKKKHNCKYCVRDFPSGCALGGHMRAHRNLIQTLSSSSSNSISSEAGEAMTSVRYPYTLRENRMTSFTSMYLETHSDEDSVRLTLDRAYQTPEEYGAESLIMLSRGSWTRSKNADDMEGRGGGSECLPIEVVRAAKLALSHRWKDVPTSKHFGD